MLEHFVHQDLALDFVHSYSGSQATCHARRREIDSISFDSTDWPGSDGQNFPVGLSGSRVAALARSTPELVRARRGGGGGGGGGGARGRRPPPGAAAPARGAEARGGRRAAAALAATRA